MKKLPNISRKLFFNTNDFGLKNVFLLRKKLLVALSAAACFTAFSSLSVAVDIDLGIRLKHCSKIEVAAERLHCFDQIMASPVIPKSAALGEKYLKKPTESRESKVATHALLRMTQDKKKRWVFEFGDGQVWRQIEARRLPRPVALPISAYLSSGIFGSFDLRLEDYSRTVKVKRLR